MLQAWQQRSTPEDGGSRGCCLRCRWCQRDDMITTAIAWFCLRWCQCTGCWVVGFVWVAVPCFGAPLLERTDGCGGSIVVVGVSLVPDSAMAASRGEAM